MTGQCDGGCAAGWNGSLCNEGIMNIIVHYLMYILSDICTMWTKLECLGFIQ